MWKEQGGLTLQKVRVVRLSKSEGGQEFVPGKKKRRVKDKKSALRSVQCLN